MQALLVVACALAFLMDKRARLIGWAKAFRRRYGRSAADAGGGALFANAMVQRGDLSIGKLGATAGFSLVVITLINGTAFNNEKMWFKDFSVAVNVADLLIVLYVCFLCGWSRNKILSLFEAVRTER
jgi:hypothetical protein